MKLKLTVVVSLCSLVSILCFAVYGYTGMDYPFHLSSWINYAAALKSGVAYPSWAAQANFGLGEPRFYFYPPISLWVGSLLYLLLPLKIVPAAYTWLAFCLAGFSMYLLSGLFLPERERLKASALYCLSFFLLVTIAKHFAIAELLTDAFVPMICFFYLKVLLREQIGALAGLALSLALAWQTDIPAAVDIAYTLFIGACIYLLQTRRIRGFLLYAAAQVLALMLSAWYLLPAFLAKQEIFPSSLNYEFRYLFSRVHTSLVDQALSAMAVISAVVLAFCLVRLRRNPDKTDGVRLLIYLGFIAFFFQLSFTRLLWDHLPELKIVGFPFRFEVFLAIALPIAAFTLRPARRLHAFVFVLYAVFAVLPLWSYMVWVRSHGPYPHIPKLAQSMANGSVGMPEYTPAGTGATALEDSDQPPSIARVSSIAAGCLATVEKWLPESRQIEVTAPSPCAYQLGLYYFPFWQLSMDGKPLSASPGPTGLINFNVPAGKYRIDARFERPNGPLLGGATVAGVAFLILATLLWRERCKCRTTSGSVSSLRMTGVRDKLS